MTEREKLLAGLPYNTRDGELIEMYHRAKEVLKSWSETSTRDGEGKFSLLCKLMGHVGDGVWIEAPFFCDYGKHISIGKNTFINTNAIFLDDNLITVGEDCLIGPYVQIYTAEHPLPATERIKENPPPGEASYQTRALPVTIGNKCWIGGNTVILPGVTIGNNVTIGAGSLVTKDIPDNVLALGSPARIIRTL